MKTENKLLALQAQPSAIELPSCAHCGEPGAQLSSIGLKFCDALCGMVYLESDVEPVEQSDQ